MSHMLRGASAAVGVGLTEFGEVPGRTAMELLAEASYNALADCGLTLKDVDGLFTSSMERVFHPLQTCEYLGVQPKVIDGTNIGGSAFVNCVHNAAMAIATGEVEVALICYGSIANSNRKNKVRGANPNAGAVHMSEYQSRQPIVSYALAAARHMEQYGTTRDQLSQVAVSTRQWAMKNPRAVMRDPLTLEEVNAARLICDPFTLFDCCLVSDAGAAVVMTTPERAKDMPHKPVYLLGAGTAITHDQIGQMPDLTVTAAAQSGSRAFAMAELGPEDVDLCEFYDAFTINTILFLEDLGFCKKGEGGAFVAEGNIGPGGKLPVNTNGGGLSCVHPGMYGLFTVAEAVEQLRGSCGERQVEGAKVAVSNGNGGVLSSQVTAVWGTADTL